MAEGRGRPSKLEQRRFFSIAFGSLRECQAVLMLANLQGNQIWDLADKIAAHLYKLIKNAK